MTQIGEKNMFNFGKRKNSSTWSAMAFAGMIMVSLSSLEAMDNTLKNMDFFTDKLLIKLTIEETIPQNCKNREVAIKFLKETPLTTVVMDPETNSEPKPKKEVGFSFPSVAPWCLLTTKYIISLNFRPNLGDWGCGHGFFSRHAVLSGANPYAIDSSKAAALEANKNIWGMKGYLPENLEMKDLYKVANTSVVNPDQKFMDRKNHINVAFNVIHYLSPQDADAFLKNLYENTMDQGIAILCCDTPFATDFEANYYNASLVQKLKYPGYGVYSKSTIVFQDNKQKNFLLRSVYRPTQGEERDCKFEMGRLYKGIYPSNGYDDGRTFGVDSSSFNTIGDLLASSKNKRPYYYVTGHQAFNKFDYWGLKNVLEIASFTVLNGWYTDHNIDTLYPHDVDTGSTVRKSKVVIVAQKKLGMRL